MPVPIHGKDYITVAERIDKFRKDAAFLGFAIKTKIISNTEYVVVRAKIIDSDGKVVATGTAEENRNDGHINQTSALENCETSAVGRALAFLGFAGTEIASADELIGAQEQQIRKMLHDSAANTMQALLDNYESVAVIKEAILNESYQIVAETWGELEDDIKKYLWKAPSKGGPFTTAERAFFSSHDYVQARNQYNGIDDSEED